MWVKNWAIASFAEGEEELDQYRRYRIEAAKAGLANPNIRFRLPEGEPYDSIYLKELRAERDMELKVRCPGDLPVWGRELAKGLRRMEFLRHAQRAEFVRRLGAAQADEHARRLREITRHGSGLSREFGEELERPARFYRAVLERESKQMGFAFDAARSTGDYVVFSKPLVTGWDLCLTPEPLVWYPGRKDGDARTLLSLQATTHRRRPIRSAKWDQVLIVEYTELVPLFDARYLRFASLDELEAVVMARIFLLSSAMKEIEAGLLAGLAQALQPGP